MLISLPKDKILGWSTWKALAADKVIMNQELKCVFRWAEYNMRRGEHAGSM